jgi:predicted nucleotidyltransferase
VISAMPASIATIVGGLVSRCPEVWLIGSRANPTGTPPKDWDIIVVGDLILLDELRARPSIDGLDLLIVYNGNDFEAPWLRPSDGAKKTGSLSEWEWKRLNDDEAAYRATKARGGSNFYVDVTTKKALRIRDV